MLKFYNATNEQFSEIINLSYKNLDMGYNFGIESFKLLLENIYLKNQNAFSFQLDLPEGFNNIYYNIIYSTTKNNPVVSFKAIDKKNCKLGNKKY